MSYKGWSCPVCGKIMSELKFFNEQDQFIGGATIYKDMVITYDIMGVDLNDVKYVKFVPCDHRMDVGEDFNPVVFAKERVLTGNDLDSKTKEE